MTRQVVIDPKAAQQLEVAYQWWAKHRSAVQAVNWYNGFLERLSSLGENPEQFSLAAENDTFPYEVRELHFGLGSQRTHRALFTIRPDMVYVFCIRHVAQQPVTPDQV